MYYSATAGGFYTPAIHGDNIPLDAVQISADQHAALLQGQSAGMRIVAGPGGVPVLQAPVGPTLAQIKADLVKNVDDAISAIYSKFTRFETEYVQREAAARAFKAGGYTGDAGVWVMAFANSAGLTAAQATDLIIQQADLLHGALALLAAQRMRKYGITAAADAAAVQALHDDIIAQATAIASGL